VAAQYQRVLARSPEWTGPSHHRRLPGPQWDGKKYATHVAVRISRPMEGCTMHPSIVFHLWRAPV